MAMIVVVSGFNTGPAAFDLSWKFANRKQESFGAQCGGLVWQRIQEGYAMDA